MYDALHGNFKYVEFKFVFRMMILIINVLIILDLIPKIVQLTNYKFGNILWSQ